MGANVTLNCTAYAYIVWWISPLFINFNFSYYDQLNKTLRNISLNATARYTFKGNNTLMTVTITLKLTSRSDIDISCLGSADPYPTSLWITNFLLMVNDSESKLINQDSKFECS